MCDLRAHTSVCSWKGTAQYYDLVVGEAINANAAVVLPRAEGRSRCHQGPGGVLEGGPGQLRERLWSCKASQPNKTSIKALLG
jgi:hypothetical protein